RATQILLQRMETLRLATFTNIPTATATEYYDPTDQATGGGGTVYTVTLATNAPTQADLRGPPIYYLTNMVKITATATWTNGNVLRRRTMQTYAAKSGIEDYVSRP